MTADANLTLRQGLTQFYRYNKHLVLRQQAGLSAEAAAFFRSHDIAHVIFGCDVSLFGEGSVKIWTLFGTTLGFRNHIKGYRSVNAFVLSTDFSAGQYITGLPVFLLAVPRLIFRAMRMSKPWPWTAFTPYLDRPIADIRKEFNIQVL